MAPITSANSAKSIHSRIGKMRRFAGVQFRTLGASAGTNYSKICMFTLGKARLTADEQERVERVLVAALRKRRVEIERLLGDAPPTADRARVGA